MMYDNGFVENIPKGMFPPTKHVREIPEGKNKTRATYPNVRRHTGHVACLFNQLTTQVRPNTCPQGNLVT